MSNLISRRAENADHILKKRFIKRVLTQEGNSILSEQRKRMQENSFSNSNFNKTKLDVSDFVASFTFKKLHRLVNIKTRKTKDVIIRKKSYPIYNQVIFGHLNNIISEISFGYTDAVIHEMKKLEND